LGNGKDRNMISKGDEDRKKHIEKYSAEDDNRKKFK
jgi:hypothetical protein